MLGMCLNWKVLAGLGAVAAGVLIFAPGAAFAVLPLLLLAACPLSMVVMMFAMKGMGPRNHEGSVAQTQTDASVESLRGRLAGLRDEERQLEQELSAPSDGAEASRPGATATSRPGASS